MAWFNICFFIQPILTHEASEGRIGKVIMRSVAKLCQMRLRLTRRWLISLGKLCEQYVNVHILLTLLWKTLESFFFYYCTYGFTYQVKFHICTVLFFLNFTKLIIYVSTMYVRKIFFLRFLFTMRFNGSIIESKIKQLSSGYLQKLERNFCEPKLGSAGGPL